MKHGTSPRTGSSGGEPSATDWSVRGNGENTTKRRPGLEHPGRSGAWPEPPYWIVWGRTRCYGLVRPRQRREYDKKMPRIGASEAERSTALAPGLDCPGVNPVPRTGASDAKERIRQKDAPIWSVRGGMKHGTSPRTGSSGGEPGAMDWSVRGNGENTTRRRPGLERPGRTGARPKPPDWIVWGCTWCRGLEHPGTQRTRTGTSGDEAAREWNVPGNKQGEGDGGGATRRGEQEQEQGTEGGGQEGEKTRGVKRKSKRREARGEGEE